MKGSYDHNTFPSSMVIVITMISKSNCSNYSVRIEMDQNTVQIYFHSCFKPVDEARVYDIGIFNITENNRKVQDTISQCCSGLRGK